MSSSAIDLTSWTKDRHNNVHRLLQVTINFAPPYYYNFFDPTESPSVEFRACLVQLHEQLYEQLHNFNSQTTNSLPNFLVSFSENSLSQS
jgi:hypothetical protein